MFLFKFQIKSKYFVLSFMELQTIDHFSATTTNIYVQMYCTTYINIFEFHFCGKPKTYREKRWHEYQTIDPNWKETSNFSAHCPYFWCQYFPFFFFSKRKKNRNQFVYCFHFVQRNKKNEQKFAVYCSIAGEYIIENTCSILSFMYEFLIDL